VAFVGAKGLPSLRRPSQVSAAVDATLASVPVSSASFPAFNHRFASVDLEPSIDIDPRYVAYQFSM
jgi:hypothetical protein